MTSEIFQFYMMIQSFSSAWALWKPISANVAGFFPVELVGLGVEAATARGPGEADCFPVASSSFPAFLPGLPPTGLGAIWPGLSVRRPGLPPTVGGGIDESESW